MQEAVLIVFSRAFRKYVIYSIHVVREVLTMPRFRSVRQYVILSPSTGCLLISFFCVCTQKVRYLLRLQNFIIIAVWLPDIIFSLYFVAKLTDTSVSCDNNL